jgi:putative transposase
MSQEMKRKAYPSDLSEAQWEKLAPLLPQPGPEDRPLEHSRREIINAIFYVLRTGCAWRQLPHDLPPWQTVYWYLRRWQKDGTWERVSSTLRQQVRVQMGREAQPSAVIIDSQSIKSSPVRGTDRGYDAYKKIRGRKRHLVVDTQGFLLAVKVTAANLSDRYRAEPLLQRVASLLPRVRHLWADHAYAGPLEDARVSAARLEHADRGQPCPPQADLGVPLGRWLARA